MKCKSCDELLSDYQRVTETEDLARKCNDNSDALMEHLRQHWMGLGPKPVFFIELQ